MSTLPEKITLQKIFDLAWQNFIVEDKPPAAKGSGACFYREKFEGGEVRKCAIGLSLPEGHDAQLYYETFDRLVLRWPELFDDEVLRLGSGVWKFQADLHDRLLSSDIEPGEPAEWGYTRSERAKIYAMVADEYGLEVPKGAGSELL